MKSIYLSLLTLIFIGCNNLSPKEYTGYYIYGHETEIFTNEKTGQDYWIYGNTEMLNQHMKELATSKKTSYPEVKVKILGIEKGKATNGLAQDSDKIMEVKKYEIISK